MKNTGAVQIISKYQISQTIVVLVATIILPLLIHLLPNINGNIAGAVLLPIFWAPMFATFVYKKHVAVLAGILAPLFNYLLLGHPVPEMVLMLELEIVMFVLVLGWLTNMKGIRYIAAPTAYILASLAAVSILSVFIPSHPFSMWINSTMTAIPGILLLCLANWVILWVRK
jgi:hypothetical protein